jgi:hypothetical protein
VSNTFFVSSEEYIPSSKPRSEELGLRAFFTVYVQEALVRSQAFPGGMQHVAEFPDCCLERLDPRHPLAIVLQYGNQLSRIQSFLEIRGAMASFPGRLQPKVLHHDQVATVQY